MKIANGYIWRFMISASEHEFAYRDICLFRGKRDDLVIKAMNRQQRAFIAKSAWRDLYSEAVKS